MKCLSDNGGTVKASEFQTLPEIKAGDYGNAYQLLANKGYIQIHHIDYTPMKFVLTPSGRHFISTSGFVHEAKLRDSPLQANRLSRWAIGISIGAAIISIIAIILSR